MTSFNVPILFLVFNRPDTTEKVFKRIREIRPSQLFIAADGPRLGKVAEKEKCEAVRQLILQGINWDCDIKTLFRDQNLGCGMAVRGALDWFFREVEAGIIIEDDVLPDLSFFPYCAYLLEKYRNNESIRFINGCNFGYKIRGDESYRFTRFMNMWGWATWRRSYQLIDFSMQEWNKLLSKEQYLESVFNMQKLKTQHIAAEYFKKTFDATAEKKIDTWDYQTVFSNLKTGTFAVFPRRNLIVNLGFGSDATHTNFDSFFLGNLITYKMDFPLKDPYRIQDDDLFQTFLLERWVGLRIRSRLYYSLLRRLNSAKRIFKSA